MLVNAPSLEARLLECFRLLAPPLPPLLLLLLALNCGIHMPVNPCFTTLLSDPVHVSDANYPSYQAGLACMPLVCRPLSSSVYDSSWVAHPNPDTQARIERAMSQRMFLVDRLDATAAPGGGWAGAGGSGAAVRQRFSVLGSTGNVYTVTLSDSGNVCTCPDNYKSRGRCKHVLFVLLKVGSSSPIGKVVC